jgi:hypothetical protein
MLYQEVVRVRHLDLQLCYQLGPNCLGSNQHTDGRRQHLTAIFVFPLQIAASNDVALTEADGLQVLGQKFVVAAAPTFAFITRSYTKG